jgi:DnaJ-class molecular chaperone
MPLYYGVLGIAADADTGQVKAAFRNLAKTCHPDIEGGNAGRFEEVHRAYEVLTDPLQRAAYDTQCARARSRARRQLAAGTATMAATFVLTVGSGVAVAGWLLGA